MAALNMKEFAKEDIIRMMKPTPGGIEELMYRRPNIGWGNINAISEGALKELGYGRAHNEAVRRSSRLSSSGMSNVMPRKTRKEHYRRKAILETRKAKERRELWERRHPGAGEPNWERREKKREGRKAASRGARRTAKRARRSSNHH